MNKTIFKVPKMDCSAEENLIRMKLENISSVYDMNFDLSRREVTVFHEGQLELIEKSIRDLNMGGKMLSTEHIEQPGQTVITENKHQRKVLLAVLFINFAFFVIEMTTGLFQGLWDWCRTVWICLLTASFTG